VAEELQYPGLRNAASCTTRKKHQRQKVKAKKEYMAKLSKEILHRNVFYRNAFHCERRLGADRQPMNALGGCSPAFLLRKAYVFVALCLRSNGSRFSEDRDQAQRVMPRA
jgi:hypothetical protein